MDAQSFLAALTPAVTDADARERFLADPRAVLAAAGLDLPEWFTVTAREGDAAELTITLPALRDPDLSDEQLEKALTDLDLNKDGVVDLNEFCRWYFTGLKSYNDTTRNMLVLTKTGLSLGKAISSSEVYNIVM